MWQEAPGEVSHGPDGAQKRPGRVPAHEPHGLRSLARDGSAWPAEQTVLGRPLKLGAFLCGNAQKITLRGVEGYYWQGAQENGSVCRGFQWVLVARGGGEAAISSATWGGDRKLVNCSWVSDSPPVK